MSLVAVAASRPERCVCFTSMVVIRRLLVRFFKQRAWM